MIILPLLLIAGFGGLLFYEKKKAGSSTSPPAGCTPATALVPGRLYTFAILPQQGTLPLDEARAETLAQAHVQTGRWQSVTAYVRGDRRAPAFAWPANAPQNAAIVRGVYTGPPAAIPASMNYAIDCGVAPAPVHAGMNYPAKMLTPPQPGWAPWGGLGLGIVPPSGLLPPSGPAVNAGYIYEDHMAGGMPMAHTGAAPALTPEQLPALVMRICAVVLAQAMSAQASNPAAIAPAAPAIPDPVPAPVPAPAPDPAPAPAAVAVAVPVPVPAQTGADPSNPSVVRRGPGLGRGHVYFAAWPSGAGPLRRDLWELGHVTDSARSPNHFAADPTKEPIPLNTVPASAPQAWLSSYGRGKAIAVLTWIGPEGGSDPAVEVLGEYAPKRPGEQVAA